MHQLIRRRSTTTACASSKAFRSESTFTHLAEPDGNVHVWHSHEVPLSQPRQPSSGQVTNLHVASVMHLASVHTYKSKLHTADNPLIPDDQQDQSDAALQPHGQPSHAIRQASQWKRTPWDAPPAGLAFNRQRIAATVPAAATTSSSGVGAGAEAQSGATLLPLSGASTCSQGSVPSSSHASSLPCASTSSSRASSASHASSACHASSASHTSNSASHASPSISQAGTNVSMRPATAQPAGGTQCRRYKSNAMASVSLHFFCVCLRL